MRIAHHPSYALPLPEGHRFPMAKYELLPQQLLWEGTAHPADFYAPEPVDLVDLLRVHDREYYDRIRTGALSEREIRDIGFPLTPELLERELRITRGTIWCARQSRTAGIALNVAGGTHHSFRNRGEGFCVFNDIAVAAATLLATGEIGRALVVDLDVHQGNGTAAIFSDEPRVFTLSYHGARNYPLRKERSDLDVGWPDGTSDDAYLGRLREELPAVVDAFGPDQVFYLSGVDVLAEDKLGRLALSLEGCRTRDQIVLQLCRDRGLPVCVSMGGGYPTRLATLIEAHANTFREARRLFG